MAEDTLLITTVTGAGGVDLTVRQVGPAAAPAILLLHGWAQSGWAWSAQLADHALTDRYRLIAPDLRGHGDSGAPAEGYDDPETWAADLDALIGHAGGRVLLVGWSYGGLVITDYLRRRGTRGVAGIALVGAVTEIGRGNPGGRIGPTMGAALPAALSEDPAVAVPALASFAAGMAGAATTGTGLPGPLVQRLLGESLRVSPAVRRALFTRTVTSASVLAAIDVPTLVLHGEEDTVVAPTAAEFAASTIPGAMPSWYEGVGHLPFLERPARFNAELAEFAGRTP